MGLLTIAIITILLTLLFYFLFYVLGVSGISKNRTAQGIDDKLKKL